VESALVAITRLPAPAIDPARVGEADLFNVIKTSFAHRRKMLRGTLSEWATPEIFEAANVAPTARPEELGLEEFARLAALR